MRKQHVLKNGHLVLKTKPNTFQSLSNLTKQ